MPSARELLDQADALMRRNRARAVDTEIPELTEIVAELAPAPPAVAAALDDVPELVDAVEEIEIASIVELPDDFDETSGWLQHDPADWSVVGRELDSIMARFAPANAPASEAVPLRSHLSIVGKPGAAADRTPVAVDLSPLIGPEPPASESTPPQSEPVAPAAEPTPPHPEPVAVVAGSTPPQSEPVAPAAEPTPPHPEAVAVVAGSTSPQPEPVAPAAESTPPTIESAPPTVETSLRVDENVSPAIEINPPAVEAATQETVIVAEILAARPGHDALQPPFGIGEAEPAVAPRAEVAGGAAPSAASRAPIADDWARWEVLAEEIRMQVLQRIDIFTDTRLRKQLSAQLQPIVDRASVQMVETINEEVGKLLRAYIAEAIEREIDKWRGTAD